MKHSELKSLEQRVPGMTLDELDALANDLKALRVTVTGEQRAGVLGINGKLYSN